MSLETIIAKAQLIPRDFGEVFEARVTGDGTIQRFELPRSNIDAASVTVVDNPSAGPPIVLTPATGLPGSGEYFLDARAGTILLGTPLPNNDVLTVDGTAYATAPPEDLNAFVEIAFDLHAGNRYPAPDIDSLPPMEEYMVALLAYREFLWSLLVEAAGDINVDTPEGMHIPAGQRYQQLRDLIDRLEAHYRELSAMLGVGLYAISMSTLRRVSRTTNRLVPIYVPQEFDDHSPPVRVLPPIDAGGPIAP